MQNETLCKRLSDLDREALFVARPNTLVEVKAKPFCLRLGDKETYTQVDALAETQEEVKTERHLKTLCAIGRPGHKSIPFALRHFTRQNNG